MKNEQRRCLIVTGVSKSARVEQNHLIKSMMVIGPPSEW